MKKLEVSQMENLKAGYCIIITQELLGMCNPECEIYNMVADMTGLPNRPCLK